MSEKVFPALAKIKPNLLETLKRRKQSFGEENKPRTVWVRMVSNAFLEQERVEQPRPFRNVLTAGIIDSNGELASGFDSIYNYNRNRNANPALYRPMPGIDTVNITNQGKFGSLRKASVSWNVSTVDDFQEVAPFFLTPGITILLEWGWGEIGSIINAVDITKRSDYNERIVEIFNNPLLLYEKAVESNGLYDGLIGRISNFNFELQDDGSYNCTTEITSMGELMAGLNLNESINYMTSNSDKEEKRTIKEYIEKYLETDFDAILDGDLRFNEFLTDCGQWDCTRAHIFASRNLVGGISQRYITWEFLEKVVINRHINIESERGFKPMVIDSKEELISNDSKLVSSDASTMLLADSNQGGHTLSFDISGDPFSGRMAHIYVNVEAVKDAFKESETLEEALDILLNRISSAGLQIWNFQLYVDPVTERLKVIDLNYNSEEVDRIDPTEEDESSDGFVFSFGGFSGESIITSANVSSNLTKQSGLTYTYAINKDNREDQGDEGETSTNDKLDTGIRSLFGVNLKDIVMENLRLSSDQERSDKSGQEDPEDISSDVADKTKNLKSLSLEELEQRIEEGLELEEGEFLVIDSQGAKFLSEYLRRKTTNNLRRHRRLLVPIKSEVTIDGISGLLPGNIYRLGNIPPTYKEHGVFQITAVNHSISDGNWETTLPSIYRIIVIEQEELSASAGGATGGAG